MKRIKESLRWVDWAEVAMIVAIVLVALVAIGTIGYFIYLIATHQIEGGSNINATTVATVTTVKNATRVINSLH